MELKEAIRILEDLAGLGERYTEDELTQAEKLGIEALERERFMREYTGITELLPSETEVKDMTSEPTKEQIKEVQEAAMHHTSTGGSPQKNGRDD